MRPRIRSAHCADVPVLLAHWRPASPEDIHVPVQLEIGPEGEEGADLFSVMIVTPEAFMARRGDAIVLAGRATMVVSGWDWEAIQGQLMVWIEGCEGSGWPEGARAPAVFCVGV